MIIATKFYIDKIHNLLLKTIKKQCLGSLGWSKLSYNVTFIFIFLSFKELETVLFLYFEIACYSCLWAKYCLNFIKSKGKNCNACS